MPPTKYNILMFAPHFAPRSGPEALVNSKLALALIKRGWIVDVISLSLSEIEIGAPEESLWGGLRQINYPVPPRYPSAWKLFLDRTVGAVLTGHLIAGLGWVRYALNVANKLTKTKKYDCVLSRSQPAVGHLPAMIISSKLHIPWIANWNDPDPPMRSPYPYGDGPGAEIGWRWQRYMKSVTNKASWHTFPSEYLRTYMMNMFGNMKDKSSVIPHIAISDIEQPISSNQAVFTVCHAGSLERQRNPDNFFKGLAQFLTIIGGDKPFEMHLVGDSLNSATILNNFPSLRKVIKFHGRQTYSESLRIMASADVVLVIEAPMAVGILLPGKFVDAVQVGRPILAISPKVGTLQTLIQNNGGGIAVDCTSPTEIAHALKILYDSWLRKTLDSEFENSRLRALFSEGTILNQYNMLFRKLRKKD